MLKFLILAGILALAWYAMKDPNRKKTASWGDAKGSGREKDITERTRIIEENSDNDR